MFLVLAGLILIAAGLILGVTRFLLVVSLFLVSGFLLVVSLFLTFNGLARLAGLVGLQRMVLALVGPASVMTMG